MSEHVSTAMLSRTRRQRPVSIPHVLAGALVVSGLSVATGVGPAQAAEVDHGHVAANYALLWMTPPTGSAMSSALGLNDMGDVVGISRPTGSAQPQVTTVWERDVTTPVVLNNLEGASFSRGFDLNDDGLAVGEGFTSTGSSTPLTWLGGPTPHQITTLNASGGGVAYDVNDSGVLAATAHNGTATRAFTVDSADDSPTELAVPEGGTVSRAVAIAENGDVAGSATVVESHGDQTHTATHATVWRDGVPTLLPSIDEDVYTTARGLNAEGVAVGEYQHAGTSTAASWENGVLVPLAPAASERYPHTTANAVSEDGIVVGGASKFLGNSSFGGAAVVWDAHGAVDLNTLVDLPEGAELRSASDINASGQIVGSASTVDGGRGFLLTPDPEVIAPAPTELTVTTTSLRHGDAGWVTIVAPGLGGSDSGPTGKVTVTLDGRPLATRTLADGRAAVRLPPSLSAGPHQLGVDYAGDATHAPAMVNKSVTVARASSKVSLTVRPKTARVDKTRLVAHIRVAVAGGKVRAFGAVQVRVRGAMVRTVRLTASGPRTLKVVLPKFHKRGAASVVARYVGSTDVRPGSDRTWVTVRR